MSQKILILIFLSCISLALNAETTAKKINIVTTTGIIKDAVLIIGADLVEVNSLMGPGVDPHLYKATYGDLVKLRNADIIFHNGLHLEGKLSEAIVNLSKTKTTVALAEALNKKNLLFSEDSLGQPDPHIWFDIALWTEALAQIPTALAKLDTKNAATYQQNYETYKKQLNDLHEWVKIEIAKIPVKQRVLLTAHDAFGYFGRTYEIEVMALQGISTAADFGLYDMKKLVDTVIERQIKAAFVETSVPQNFINALIAGANARGQNLKLGGELYSDALGEPGSLGQDYIGMVKHNVTTIVAALLGEQN